MITIEPYHPQWPEEFEAIRASLQDLLGSLALRIDHIGSTSVPGLGAKDVIDVQVTVRALTQEVKRALIQAGYHFHETYTHDHVPLGESDDPRLWEKFTFSQPEGHRRANVHVRIDGNPNQRYALLFRDYLRVHPNSARSIELIKREIAKRHAEDIEAYYDIKDPVYDLIWDAAQNWARHTGWDKPNQEENMTQRMQDPLRRGVLLRGVIEDDLPIFFEQQLDPQATQMAAFPARDWEAFMAHWTKILADDTVTLKTILFDGQVAGNIVSFEQSGETQVGYWLGQEYWGKGVATQALSAFLDAFVVRPLYAYVAKHNIASLRVLEKCGFRMVGEDKGSSGSDDEGVEEYILKLG